jgi:hypothetical protein
MVTKVGLIFEDFIGTDDNMSTWRVSDGGMIGPEWFDVIFVTKSKAGYALCYEWYGDEASNLVLVQQKKTIFHNVLHGYRYTAPM